MNSLRTRVLTLMAAAAMAACSTTPADNFLLGQARNDYRAAQADAQTQALAANELRVAGEALTQAEAAQVRRDDVATVDQLAYLARQRTALARETARRKGAEAMVAQAGAETARMRLAARTQEADAATAAAGAATRDAAAATRDAAAAQRDAARSQQQAASSQQQAALSQQQADEAQRRNAMLETQLRELNAKQTERGLVITIGDVLFDSGQANLRSGGMQSMQRLGGFLKQYPQRKALIEGYTDSVGGDSMNVALSTRRAEAVMTALLGMGVAREQLTAQGYGESNPVAANDSAGGRQANRRVEIVLSDENGAVKGR